MSDIVAAEAVPTVFEFCRTHPGCIRDRRKRLTQEESCGFDRIIALAAISVVVPKRHHNGNSGKSGLKFPLDKQSGLLCKGCEVGASGSAAFVFVPQMMREKISRYQNESGFPRKRLGALQDRSKERPVRIFAKLADGLRGRLGQN